MKTTLFLLLIVLSIVTVLPVAAISSQDIASQVHVTSVDVNPGTLYPYETGIVTVNVENTGNQSVAMSHATISSNDIHLINTNSYENMIYLNPGSKMSFVFQVKAGGNNGVYFPIFSTDIKDSGTLNYPFNVRVDSSDITVGVSQKPDNFAVSKKDTLSLSVVNPRDSEVDNLLIIPSGEGIDVNPQQFFASKLDSMKSVDVPFSVTPNTGSNLTFHITFNNGVDNKHSMDYSLDLPIGEDKLGVIPVVNNLALTSMGDYYKLNGDISNSGINDAKGVIVTVKNPASPVDPSREESIGSLSSGDFSSFEITFSSPDLVDVPLLVQWKDNDGNSFSKVIDLNLRSLAGSGSGKVQPTGTSSRGGAGGPFGGIGRTSNTGISGFIPLIAGILVIIVAIVLYKKRRWISSKIKKN